jgi:hypothetical protein
MFSIENWFSLVQLFSGAKAPFHSGSDGTAEAVPFPKPLAPEISYHATAIAVPIKFTSASGSRNFQPKAINWS